MLLLMCPVETMVSTHMPLARHDTVLFIIDGTEYVSTHMPLAGHDKPIFFALSPLLGFYSHASCEA